MPTYHYDCLKFRGYKPCIEKRMCGGCDAYQPWERKIAIIKLGALGDVLRTTPILRALRRKYPLAHITWITKSGSKEMLEGNPRLNRLLFVDQPDAGAMARLLVEEFDEVHNYDKEDAAIGLAALIKAPKKFGFVMNRDGQMSPVNEASKYCFDLGLSDELKFRQNKKTYQEVTYECSELDVPAAGMDPYDFLLNDADREPAEFLVKRLRWMPKKGVARAPIIGLNTGAGRVFRTKQWDESCFIELARLLRKKLKAHVLILGGADEDARNKRIVSKLNGAAHYPGCGFGIRQFAGLLERCDLVVTGDTLGMHLALAVAVPVVVMFGPTCEQEVDVYGMGRKLVGTPPCAPCYKNECDQTDWMKCMREIRPQHVFEAVAGLLREKENSTRPPNAPA